MIFRLKINSYFFRYFDFRSVTIFLKEKEKRQIRNNKNHEMDFSKVIIENYLQ